MLKKLALLILPIAMFSFLQTPITEAMQTRYGTRTTIDSYTFLRENLPIDGWHDESENNVYSFSNNLFNNLLGKFYSAERRSTFCQAGNNYNYGYDGYFYGKQYFNHAEPVNFTAFIHGKHYAKGWDAVTIALKDGNGNYLQTNHYHRENVHKNISIGGITLGTTKSKLLHFYGEPTRKEIRYHFNTNEDSKFTIDAETWYYDKDKWNIEILDGLVYRINVSADSPKVLDDYGVGPKSSITDIARAFGKPTDYGNVVDLSDGTYIVKDENGICLMPFYEP